jgi:hypothetical protein
MPEMTEGPSNEPPGRQLTGVWATLSKREAWWLLQSLETWWEEIEEGRPDPGWHTHVGYPEATELTIAVDLEIPDDGRHLPAKPSGN